MKLFDTRVDMIRSLIPPGRVCAEIGVFEGVFSKQIVDTIRPSTLYMIDIFTGVCCSGNQDGNNVVYRTMEDVYRDLVLYTEEDPSLHLLKGKSVDVLATFPDGSLDMVYLDGDHSYEGVKADLVAALPKVRSGGWILGHDYEMNMTKAQTSYAFGVKRAVDEFCARTGQTLSAKAMDGCVSFGIQVVK